MRFTIDSPQGNLGHCEWGTDLDVPSHLERGRYRGRGHECDLERTIALTINGQQDVKSLGQTPVRLNRHRCNKLDTRARRKNGPRSGRYIF